MKEEEKAGYHHGDLRGALLEAAIAILKEGSADRLTMREAARRAGVSSAAPFRHFPNKAAFMGAIAEEGLNRLCYEIEEVAFASKTEDPLQRYQEIGRAYLRWAFKNPTLFEVISTPGLFDLEGENGLRAQNQRLIAITERTLRDAADKKQIERADVGCILITGRAVVYGLARMWLDGHFPRWGVELDAVEQSADAALSFFVDGLGKRHVPEEAQSA